MTCAMSLSISFVEGYVVAEWARDTMVVHVLIVTGFMCRRIGTILTVPGLGALVSFKVNLKPGEFGR